MLGVVFVSRAPRAALSPFVRALWNFEHTFDGRSRGVEFVPKARPFVTLCLEHVPRVRIDGELTRSARVSLNGLVDRVPLKIELKGRMRLLAAELSETGLHCLTGESATLFVNEHVDLCDFVEPHGIERLLERARACRSPQTMIDGLEELLVDAFLRHPPRYDTAAASMVRRAVLAAERSSRSSTPGMLASQLSVSTRTLQRAFSRTVGLAPRRWLAKRMLARVHERLRSRGEASIEGCALELGFHDAAHLRKFVREHAGCAPVKLAAPERDVEARMLHYAVTTSPCRPADRSL